MTCFSLPAWARQLALRGVCTLALGVLSHASALALTTEQTRALTLGDTDARVTALQKALASPDAPTAAFLQAMADDAVKVNGTQVLVVRDGKAFDPVSGEATALPDTAEDVINNNRMRGEIDAALSALQLLSPDAALRVQAAKSVLKEPDPTKLAMLEKALASESNEGVKKQMLLARAAILLNSNNADERFASAKTLADSQTPDTQLLLNQRLSQEEDKKVRAQLQTSLLTIQAALSWGEKLGALFTGISLGSILLLVALGLAITYGLMGVINMAHGELMMIGAYATYVVQGLFRQYLPGMFDAYLLVAVPASFLAAALVGAVLERLVLRHLYGRPLETLLATWGISLVLMQGVRSIFGAQNVGVENPSWMSGGVQLLANLSLPYNRLIIIGFAVFVLVGMTLLISKTRLGLFVRGVTQNRPMASALGVNTARIDTYAFSLGCGIAGLAGCALSQIGNVGPDLGQNYIVDAFMVVVLGGVGQLAGTVYAAMGLGLMNKLLEGVAGAVLAKIAVLVFIIVFIQKRPQGIFAMKGRSAEA
ncbi:urea ABC transporter permease subunit UrtB [Limnohabitans sp. INBF002]|uniref:urea ABC transporter permease subunit UrtB n=1 Tax=Limnohabitans sp. INBF002 TaxID=2986280 RepID=UPI00237733D0|nr:urea ABC transporter permease subunit UrtB [Limnohabitans sp. INBF002]BDU51851.1 branched-chain amino acid ABC transporter permease [Limnohabitans sp. INBF002]